MDRTVFGSDGATVWGALDSMGYRVITVTRDRRVVDRFFLQKSSPGILTMERSKL